VGPEPAPVFAQAPALVLEAPLPARHLQLVVGPALGERFGGIEDGEVLADDLLGRVALDALGTLVPAHDAAVRVEEEDAVVLDGLHHQPEPLFALAELILVLPPLG